MIDYDKLEIAHKMTDKINFDLMIKIRIINNDYSFTAHLYDPKLLIGNMYYSVDSLINGLTEITHPKCKCGNALEIERTVCNECIEKAVASIKPNPKYELGQKVWHLFHEEIEEGIVEEVDYNDKRFLYSLSTGWWEEEQLYPSHQALIEAQIDYWKALLGEELEQDISFYCQPKFDNGSIDKCSESIRKHHELEDECTHESDGKYHLDPLPVKNKCIKCGEYYR